MKTWLKVLAVLLLAYAVIASFLFPLAPGGLTVDIEKITPGENNFTFTGYNSHFTSDSLQVFVVSDTTAFFCCTVLEVINDSKVLVSVALPDTLPSNDIGFYVNTPIDGTIYIQKPLDLTEFTFIEGVKPMSACEVKGVNDEHSEFGYPFQVIIFETIRNLLWHVPMWFTMFVLMGISFAQSIRVLSKSGREDALDASISFKTIAMFDLKAATAANTGLLFCILGLITGSIWARFTWGHWWTFDPQLNGAMVVFLMYMAYFILKNSVNDEEKRARLAAIFNIFAFILMVVLLMVMPRFADSLHPGKSGNPAFSSYDLDSSLRMVFYPAVLGYILLGWWLYSIHLRIKKLEWRDEK